MKNLLLVSVLVITTMTAKAGSLNTFVFPATPASQMSGSETLTNTTGVNLSIKKASISVFVSNGAAANIDVAIVTGDVFGGDNHETIATLKWRYVQEAVAVNNNTIVQDFGTDYIYWRSGSTIVLSWSGVGSAFQVTGILWAEENTTFPN